MEPSSNTLLIYENPALVTPNTERKSPKTRPLKVSPELLVLTGPVPPPPKPKSTPAEIRKKLNDIFPPREWKENNQHWVQQVSSTPATRKDVVCLQELLDLKLQQRQARKTGICPVRSELYSQCFDELIRQITINCPERGWLLLRVQNEIDMTNTVYQTLHASGITFGIKKALQAEKESTGMQRVSTAASHFPFLFIYSQCLILICKNRFTTELYSKIADLENKKKDLERQVNEQKAKCEEIEGQEVERRQVEEKQHTAQIELLKRTNQGLKAYLEEIINPKK